MNKNNSATVEPNLNLHDYNEYEDNDDAISLSSFPIYDGGDDESDRSYEVVSYHNSSDQDLFEFFANPITVPQVTNSANQIVFCGKIIQHQQDDHLGRSSSLRVPTSKPASLAPSAAIGKDRCSSTLLSRTQSRRRPFTFGLVKFPPEMELSDIRKRQSRRPPATMFSAVDVDREPAMASSGCGRGGRGNWGGLIRMLRGKSHLGSALAKTSLGCISLV